MTTTAATFDEARAILALRMRHAFDERRRIQGACEQPGQPSVVQLPVIPIDTATQAINTLSDMVATRIVRENCPESVLTDGDATELCRRAFGDADDPKAASSVLVRLLAILSAQAQDCNLTVQGLFCHWVNGGLIAAEAKGQSVEEFVADSAAGDELIRTCFSRSQYLAFIRNSTERHLLEGMTAGADEIEQDLPSFAAQIGMSVEDTKQLVMTSLAPVIEQRVHEILATYGQFFHREINRIYGPEPM